MVHSSSGTCGIVIIGMVARIRHDKTIATEALLKQKDYELIL